jgi:uncharacterized protein
MANRINQSILLVFLFLLIIPSAQSQDFPDPKEPPRYVNDFARFFSPTERKKLEKRLVEFEKATSNEIAIITVSSLQGFEPADYAQRIGEKWGVGKEDKDNGIVVLIKPKTASSKGRVFIATGYGMEGAVPDAAAKQIVESEIIPHFKEGEFYEGINSALDVIFELTRGEYTADEYIEQKQLNDTFTLFIIIGFFLLMFALFFFRAKRYSATHDVGLWTALMLMSTSGGGRGFGGSGGGGFGGFGGGGFGGGGAGGSW